MCLTAPVVQAQQHSFFTHYSTEDGLSQNTVMSMLQDHKDNLWFATWDGINRFDGYNFKTYKARQGNYISLTNNRADRMYEDRYGFLWLLTYDNRVHRFDPKTETFDRFRQQVKKVVHITLRYSGIARWYGLAANRT